MAFTLGWSMVQAELRTIQQRPEHVGQAFGFAVGVGPGEVAFQPLAFRRSRLPAKCGQGKRLDPRGLRQPRRLGDGDQGRAALRVGGPGDEASIEQRQCSPAFRPRPATRKLLRSQRSRKRCCQNHYSLRRNSRNALGIRMICSEGSGFGRTSMPLSPASEERGLMGQSLTRRRRQELLPCLVSGRIGVFAEGSSECEVGLDVVVVRKASRHQCRP